MTIVQSPHSATGLPGRASAATGQTATRTRLILISENTLARSGIAAMIARQPDLQVIAEIGSHVDLGAIGSQQWPDLFLMDVPTVRQETVEVVRQIVTLRRGSPTPTLILSGSTGDYIYDLLRLGSCTLMGRGAGPEELIAGIRMLAAGYVLIERRHAGRLASAVRRFKSEDDIRKYLIHDLTKRERDVLALIALGLPNTEIAESLSVANSTVKSHVKAIYRKLGLRNRFEAIMFTKDSGDPTRGHFAVSQSACDGRYREPLPVASPDSRIC